MWFVRDAEHMGLQPAGRVLRRHLGPSARDVTSAPLLLARLGQLLSATSTSVLLLGLVDVDEAADLHSDSGEVTSDGCGYASYALLERLYLGLRDEQHAAQRDGRRPTGDEWWRGGGGGGDGGGNGVGLPHSAAQIRIGGCKGVVSLRMGVPGRQLYATAH